MSWLINVATPGDTLYTVSKFIPKITSQLGAIVLPLPVFYDVDDPITGDERRCDDAFIQTYDKPEQLEDETKATDEANQHNV